MKKTIRIAVLMLGLVGLYLSVSVPQAAADGIPISTHPHGGIR